MKSALQFFIFWTLFGFAALKELAVEIGTSGARCSWTNLFFNPEDRLGDEVVPRDIQYRNKYLKQVLQEVPPSYICSFWLWGCHFVNMINPECFLVQAVVCAKKIIIKMGPTI